jgi:dTDP-4-dehydrorhamnose reductase
MSRWLITGAGGMLGRDLVTVLDRCGAPVTGLSRADLDITDAGQVQAALDRWPPDVVVNRAAWTAVDAAEADEAAALRVNGQAVAGLAAQCAAAGDALVQLSTDYVFDGQASEPYPEDGGPAPRTAYGGPSWLVSRPCWASRGCGVTCCAPPGFTGRTAAASSGR